MSAAGKEHMLIGEQVVPFDDFKALASSNCEFHLKIEKSV